MVRPSGLYQFRKTSKIMGQLRYLEGFLGWREMGGGASPLQELCMHWTAEKRKNAGIHTYLDWDSNPRLIPVFER
jgi:hypothetical protein